LWRSPKCRSCQLFSKCTTSYGQSPSSPPGLDQVWCRNEIMNHLTTDKTIWHGAEKPKASHPLFTSGCVHGVCIWTLLLFGKRDYCWGNWCYPSTKDKWRMLAGSVKFLTSKFYNIIHVWLMKICHTLWFIQFSLFGAGRSHFCSQMHKMRLLWMVNWIPAIAVIHLLFV
jgi:hypothetical protein